MFTGIIEHLGAISHLEISASGGKLTVHSSSLAPHLVVSASVAVNGCCLTVVHRNDEHFSADLSPETLSKTSFPALKPGARVNLEQPLTAGKEFGGHFVLGHVDATGRVSRLTHVGSPDAAPENQSWLFAVEVPADVAPYIVSKGSVTIDGISLTVARWHNNIAEIAVIPYTYTHTNLRDRVPGDLVNLEADILGKYLERCLRQHRSTAPSSPLTIPELLRQGF